MARHQVSLPWLASLSILLLACGTAYADRVAHHPRSHTALAPAPAESPYQVELIGQSGFPLETYEHRGRYYVLGDAGQRYSIRVTNPTGRRVEAVISVDGLDVIDGKSADLRKRGYVVRPYGELKVDGFRVSTREVATFRFSSVASSYAGRKGKARNVGVIGVAIFEERHEVGTFLVEPRAPVDRYRSQPRDHYDDDVEIEIEAGEAARGSSGADAPRPGRAPVTRRGAMRDKHSADRAPAATEKAAPSPRAPGPRAIRPTPPAPDSTHPGSGRTSDGDVALGHRSRGHRCCRKRPRHRPGLGTEFGEHRHSAATWTRFVRSHPSRPDAMAELRYNDATGLQALGIPVEYPHHHELMTRETADPFPGTRFAEPPR